MALVDIAVSVRTKEANPWLDRLLVSLQAFDPGVPAALIVEDGKDFSRVEKRLRVLRRSKTRYLCICEDDTEIIHDGWLASMMGMLTSVPGVACVSPQETRAIVPETGLPRDAHAELLMAPGFCFLLDREAKPWWDIRVQTMDDLYLSLRLRSRGWRLGVCGKAVVRHTKTPWASDDLPPWEQADRMTGRFDAQDAYFQAGRHEAKRLQEALFLVQEFGDLARQMVPPELMACIQSRGADEAVLLRESPEKDGWAAYKGTKAAETGRA